MLRLLRSKTGRIIFGSAALLIIPSFALFYGYSPATNASKFSPTAKLATLRIDGSDLTITNAELQAGQNYVMNRMAISEALQGNQPDRQALEAVASTPESFLGAVDRAIVLNHGKKMGLRVGSEQIVNELARQIPDPAQRFQQMQMLEKQTGMRFDDFIEQRRLSAEFQIAEETIKECTRVTINEAWIAHVADSENLTMEVVQLYAADFREKPDQPTTTVLANYLAANADRFRIPDQAVYRYIVVSKDDLRVRAEITDEETSAAYEQNKEQYLLPRAVQASAIYIPGTSSESTTVAAEAKRIAQDVADRARKGEDFSELFAQFSAPYALPEREPDSPAVSGGGALGLISENVARTQFGDDWTSAVFSAEPGTVVGPINSGNGQFIVKVDLIRNERYRTLDEVAAIIRTQLAAAKADQEFERLGKLLAEKVHAVTTLNQLAEVTGTTVTESGKTNKNSQYLPRLGMLGDFAEVIRDLDQNMGLELYSDDHRHLVIQLVEEFPSRVPELSEVWPAVFDAWLSQESLRLAHIAAERIRASAQSGADLAKLAIDNGTTVTKATDFTRKNSVEALGMSVDNFYKKSLGLKAGDFLVEEFKLNPVAPPAGVAVMRLVSTREPNRSEFLSKLPEITSELRSRKRSAFLNDYLAAERLGLSPTVTILANSLKRE
jgi:peptidyl-prolyl cis-trans isomerase D